MLKLITLNIEMNKHYHRLLPFLDEEVPDVVCLQEAPESILSYLHERGFVTVFAPMIIKELNGEKEKVGVVLATKLPFSTQKVYYHGIEENLAIANGEDDRRNTAFVYLLADIEFGDTNYRLATTHMADTDDGHEDDFQIMVMNKLLSTLSREESHCLCGDLNMPRGFNTLYDDVTKIYNDAIPKHYQSSLDKNLHRAGRMKLDQPIFDCYMVDYIFTQSPYEAKVKKMQFGVSDHAGVVAYISKLA